MPIAVCRGLALSIGGISRRPKVNVMKNRHVLNTLPVLAFLTFVPVVGLSSDSELSLEEAREAATELLQSVGAEYECDIFNIVIRKSTSAKEGSGYYLVSYDAIGFRCILADQELRELGESRGLRFDRRPRAETIDKVPEDPNPDPIHEVDPPVEVGKWFPSGAPDRPLLAVSSRSPGCILRGWY